MAQNGPNFLICAVVTSDAHTTDLAEFLAAATGGGASAARMCFVLMQVGAQSEKFGTHPDLATLTPWPVLLCEDGARFEPGRVFVLPPRSILDLKGGAMMVTPLRARDDDTSVIDPSLANLGGHFRERSSVAVLMPVGADGIAGLMAVAEAGGFALALDSGSTAPQMETAVYAVRGDAPGLAAALLAEAGRISRTSPAPLPLSTQHLHEACDIVRDVCQVDFRHYKETTLNRRILRRMSVLGCTDFAEYRAILTRGPDEPTILMRDLLIGVTSFFRDAEAFSALAGSALASLFGPGRTDPVRIWVPACGTGQEAYTLAILAQEAADAAGSAQPFQIFATDLNDRALTMARRGLYPAAITDEVTPDRLERFFRKSGTRWQVSRELRQRIVFSRQNLIGDPPFSQMNLISCRNLLIYLGEHLQIKLMSVFHFSLLPEGYLFLGSSESVSGHSNLFSVVDARHRIARRKEIAVRDAAPILRSAGPGPSQTNPMAGRSADLGAIAQRILLDEFAPPYLIADETGQISYLSAGAEAFLRPSEGLYINNILRMVAEALRPGLRVAWYQAVEQRRTAVFEGVAIETVNGKRHVRITVQPMPDLGSDQGNYMVVFSDRGVLVPDHATRPGEPGDGQLAVIEAELLRTRHDLELAVQNLEAANEELKSTNEELLSINEELQSTNEELESSKEEISREAEAHARTAADLRNLLQSTQIATIFLDGVGTILGFTPSTVGLYNLVPEDVGRPLSHFTHSFADLPAMPPVQSLAPDAVPEEAEVRHRDGRTFLRRMTPYIDAKAQSVGVVLTFIDITEQRTIRDELARALAGIETIYRSAPVGLAEFGPDLTFVRINDRLAEMNGVPAVDHIGRRIREIVPNTAEEADTMLRGIFETGIGIGPVEFHGKPAARPGETIVFLVNWAPVFGPNGKVMSVLASAEDISERIRTEALVVKNADRLRKTLDGILGFVGVMSPDGILIEANAPAVAVSGLDREMLLGNRLEDTFWFAHSPDVQARAVAAVARAQAGAPVRYDETVRIANGEFLTIDFQLVPCFDDDGTLAYLIPSGFDISERKRAEQAQVIARQRLELALSVGTLGIFDWDTSQTEMDWTDTAYLVCGYQPGEVPATFDAWLDRTHPEDRARIVAALDRARESRSDFQFAYRLVHPDGKILDVETQGSFLVDATGANRLIGIIKDVSDLRRSELRLREMMEVSQVGIVLASLDGLPTEANDAFLRMIGRDRNELLAGTIVLDDHFVPQKDDLLAPALPQGRATLSFESIVRRADGTEVPVLVNMARIDGERDEYVAFLIDLTLQKASDTHRDLLMAELNHRVKNTLATVQAMAAHTLRGATNVATFRETFSARLQAIASSHNILNDTGTGRVGIADLIQQQVGPYATVGTQVMLEGGYLTLSPATAHSLGLILHELTTNAAKYGALLYESGRIHISWETHSGGRVRLVWEESGGPSVTPPTRTGFGSRLITSTLSHTLDGSATLDYNAGGLRAVLDLPKESVYA